MESIHRIIAASLQKVTRMMMIFGKTNGWKLSKVWPFHSANRPAVEKAPLMSSDITFVKSDITFVKSDITSIKSKNPLLQIYIIRTNEQILGLGYQKLYLLFEI